MTTSNAENKQMAANIAVDFVQSNMIIGLGSGSTAELALQSLAGKYHTGLVENIFGIPSSNRVESLALRLDFPLTSLEQHPLVDLTIDGADEISPEFYMIKGGGGALLREKILAQASQRLIIIVDETKMSSQLGSHWVVPVEVVPFGWRSQAIFLETLGAKVRVRFKKDGVIYKTDQGNMILDCDFGPIKDVDHLANQLDRRAGIVEHGLFIHLSPEVIICGEQGCRHISSTREMS
ncbi:MAG: ribose 5-phosphate isomerase A [Anaerolineales bacterium]|nr:ribose 5-phosphate isomerase A [Anaerolineales bacterium]